MNVPLLAILFGSLIIDESKYKLNVYKNMQNC